MTTGRERTPCSGQVAAHREVDGVNSRLGHCRPVRKGPGARSRDVVTSSGNSRQSRVQSPSPAPRERSLVSERLTRDSQHPGTGTSVTARALCGPRPQSPRRALCRDSTRMLFMVRKILNILTLRYRLVPVDKKDPGRPFLHTAHEEEYLLAGPLRIYPYRITWSDGRHLDEKPISRGLDLGDLLVPFSLDRSPVFPATPGIDERSDRTVLIPVQRLHKVVGQLKLRVPPGLRKL